MNDAARKILIVCLPLPVKKPLKAGLWWFQQKWDWWRERLSADPDSHIRSGTHRLTLPVSKLEESTWESRYFMNGRVPGGSGTFSAHVSILAPGASPHPPHGHPEEEILIILDGSAKLILPDCTGAPEFGRWNGGSLEVRPGQGVFYPRGFRHTIEGTGDSPVHYLMFKWRGPKNSPATPSLPFTVFEKPGRTDPGIPFESSPALKGPTRYLDLLEIHTSRVEPGAGYAPHRDRHDVGIVCLEGTISSCGEVLEPFDFQFLLAGMAHGLKNSGTSSAHYWAFEFHRPDS